MKRILFVDDEVMVLQGLRRILRSMRDEWDMEYVGSGAEALDCMAEKLFDVVVSDLRMPGMNGAELLNQVMLLYPRTVRFILSGTADRELTLKCVGFTHQCLSKPCDVEELKATIARASSMAESLENGNLTSLVAKMDRLPTLPTVYTQIVQALQNPNATIEEVGEIIARDIGMTAKILKLVNSAFFGLGREIATPSEAAMYLGIDTLRSLVLSTDVFSQFEAAQAAGFSLQALSNHSLETAAAAKAIARNEGLEQRLLNKALVAGMLHDAGKLVLAANFPDQYGIVLRKAAHEKKTVATAEKEILGADHAEVGGYLLGLWGLPVPIVEAIALHHCPGLAAHKKFSPLTAVHVANVIVKGKRDSNLTIPIDQIDEDYLAELGLSNHLEEWQDACDEATSYE